mgnify:CR=1 FL=1
MRTVFWDLWAMFAPIPFDFLASAYLEGLKPYEEEMLNGFKELYEVIKLFTNGSTAWYGKYFNQYTR